MNNEHLYSLMFIESKCQMDCNIYNRNKYVENIFRIRQYKC